MNRTRSYFTDSAAVILFFMAALNFLGAIGPADALNWPDPLVQLSNRWILVICGGFELFVSAILLAGKNSWIKLGLLAWLATILLVYRLILWRAGSSNFGDCLGNYIEWFLISPRTMGMVAKGLIGLMLAGSYAFLVLNWLRGRKSRRAGKSAKTPAARLAAQPGL